MRQRESVLSNLKANNADLEKDVRRFQERKRLLEKVSAESHIKRALCDVSVHMIVDNLEQRFLFVYMLDLSRLQVLYDLHHALFCSVHFQPG